MPGRGRTSLALSAFGNGGSIGYWTMISDRTNLGVRVGLSLGGTDFDGGETGIGLSISAGPALKRYLRGSARPVAPFLYGGLNASWGEEEMQGGEVRRGGAGLEGGFGVDWFPAPQVSIGGYTGARLAYSHQAFEFDAPTDRSTQDAWTLGTFTSGVVLHIYFGGPRAAAGPGVAAGEKSETGER